MTEEITTQDKYTSHANTFTGFIQRWIAQDLDKKRTCRKYKSNADMTELYYEGEGRNTAFGKDVLAIRLKDGRVIGNASRLQRCGSYRKGDEAPAQRVMFELAVPMIPFNVFEEAGMDIRTVKVVEQGAEEDFLLPQLIWSDSQSMLVPMQIRKRDSSKTKPVSDDKKKILKVTERESREYVRDKQGRYIKNKDGSDRMKTTKYFDYEYYDLTVLTKRHFVGAMLLQLKGKTYLFDVDRNELEFYRFNPFLSELPENAKTIEEAYEMLKPLEVKKALKEGLNVRRQGEWFFIPTPNMDFKEPPKPSENRYNRYDRERKLIYKRFDLSSLRYNEDLIEESEIMTLAQALKQAKESESYRDADAKYKKQILGRVRAYMRVYKAEMPKLVAQRNRTAKAWEAYEAFTRGGDLRAGENRPNRVSKMYMDVKNKATYVRGTVKHTGREHEDIELHAWHKAIPNTATKSFTITGNID